MGLYLGEYQIKLYLNNDLYKPNLYAMPPIVNGALLISSDDYMLQDTRNKYLTAKEGD